MNAETMAPWGSDWAWGVPVIVFTVMFHVFCLNFLKQRTDRRIHFVWQHQIFSVGIVTLCITLLHGLEAAFWTFTFVFLGAIPDRPAAMLYSLNALTAFGHTDVTLSRKWQLMGAMESLNGWILFGLSVAYLFVLVQLIASRDAQALQSSNTKS